MIFYRKEAETQLLTSRLEEEQSLVARLQKQVFINSVETNFYITKN